MFTVKSEEISVVGAIKTDGSSRSWAFDAIVQTMEQADGQ
jgi:hypothetical protein